MEIVGLAVGGRGVARQEGLVVFVEGGLPGDQVEVEILERRARHAIGRAGRILRPSPLRRTAPCPLQDSCGGCPWMTLEEPEQTRWKERLLAESLRRIGGAGGVPVEAALTSSRSLGYRNKLELSLGRSATGRRHVGLRGRMGEVVDVARCLLPAPPLQELLTSARDYLLDPRRPVDALFDGPAGPSRLVLRLSRQDGSLLVGLRPGGPGFTDAPAFAAHLAALHERLAGFVLLVGSHGRRGGLREQLVWGRDWIEERISGIPFRVNVSSFLQVNVDLVERLAALVADVRGRVAGETVLDLYGGVGIHGLAAAAAGAAEVVVVEADARAVACGREAAAGAGLAGSVRFLRGDVLRTLAGHAARPAVVVANPPRSGLGRGVAAAIAGCGPRRVVLVSCDPPTLARDVRELAGRGFRLERVVPVDQFPQTAHVEAVATLARG